MKVFSATMAGQRQELGETVTSWLASHPSCQPTDFIITQSSDSRFHCISIVLFYLERRSEPLAGTPSRSDL